MLRSLTLASYDPRGVEEADARDGGGALRVDLLVQRRRRRVRRWQQQQQQRSSDEEEEREEGTEARHGGAREGKGGTEREARLSADGRRAVGLWPLGALSLCFVHRARLTSKAE